MVHQTDYDDSMYCLGAPLSCLQYSRMVSLWPGQTYVPPVPRLTEASDERPQQGEGRIPPRHLRGWAIVLKQMLALKI